MRKRTIRILPLLDKARSAIVGCFACKLTQETELKVRLRRSAKFMKLNEWSALHFNAAFIVIADGYFPSQEVSFMLLNCGLCGSC